MSKISLKHSGGNVVSLNSPTSAPTSSDVAFKLPNADGTNGQVLKTDGSGNLSFGADTGGKILQVISTTKTDSFTTTSTSYTDITDVTATITPKFSSSKILIQCTLAVSKENNHSFFGRIVRNGSVITGSGGVAESGHGNQIDGVWWNVRTQIYSPNPMTVSYLDSPSSTSATTYKLQAYSPYSSAYTIGINSGVALDNYTYMNNCVSTITAMEVAA